MPKVKDYVIKKDYNNKTRFREGQELIISTRNYIYFNGSYHHSILENEVIYSFIDSKGRLHLVC